MNSRALVFSDFLPLFYETRTKRHIQKHHQRSGEITEGVVKSILTSSPTHPHGINIMTDDKKVGRVVEILEGLD